MLFLDRNNVFVRSEIQENKAAEHIRVRDFASLRRRLRDDRRSRDGLSTIVEDQTAQDTRRPCTRECCCRNGGAEEGKYRSLHTVFNRFAHSVVTRIWHLKNSLRMTLIALALAGCSNNAPQPAASPDFGPVVDAQATVAPKDLGDLSWRVVGPAVMGGRLDAVAGVPGDPTIVYLGHSSGGLYKSGDGGMSFTSIFNKGLSASIGAVAVAPSDPKTLYIGTGEGFPRNTAALGDGVFVSRDAGKTWGDAGLKDSQHIARIAISPSNPNVALVASMGHEFTPGGERGIYRTTDGGKSWTRTLYVNETTGGSDVEFDPSNASVAFAGTFDYIRHPWGFRGGGVGSGLWKSTDGGVTWKRLTDAALRNGLPSGIINRVGLAISAHHSNTIYAIVPSAKGMLYRSDDGGSQWKLVSADKDLVFRPFYFSQIKVNPDDVNDVWVISGGLRRSHDGGKKFKSVNAGGDNHDLWIDPTNPKRVFLGSDVGFDYTLDGGNMWSFDNVQPFSQVYRVGYDHALPYHVMGGMQDHETWWGPNTLWNNAGVDGGSWRNITPWGDGQYAKPAPDDDNIIYANTHFGDLGRLDLRTGEYRNISPLPTITFGQGAESNKYRFNWSAPLMVSTHEPGAVYFGAQVLFRTKDGGQSWDTISPDLTAPCDKSYLVPSGGPLTHDNTNAETYCTIYALAEESNGTLWAGTDNGHLQISHGGGSWTDVYANIQGLPAQAMVDSIEPGKGVVFATFDRHRLGDTKAYVYETTDDGSTWKNISASLPLWAYAVRQDPRAPQLLFAGTEDGIYTSFDGGAHWSSLLLGTAPVPVYDLQIQPDANDLILGTHGRGFAILDDIAPLEGLARASQRQVALFAPADAYRYAPRPFHDLGQNEFLATPKPYGTTISYYLKPKPEPKVKPKKKPAKEKVELQILDGQTVIRHIEATADDGVNRVVWDLATDAPGGLDAKQDARPYYVFYALNVSGPEVLPGTYTVRLKARGQTLTVPVTVKMDPALHANDADLRAQYDALNRLAALQERGETWIATLTDDAKRLAKKDPKRSAALNAQADRLRNGNGSQNAGYQFPAKVVDQIAYMRFLLATSFTGPTQSQAALMDDYAKQIDEIGKDVEPLIKSTAPLLPKTTASPHPEPQKNRRGRPAESD